MYQEGIFEARTRYVRPQVSYNGYGAMGLTSDEACVQARAILTTLDPRWENATCDQIRQHVCCEDNTIFVGNDPIRLALCGSIVFPAPSCQGGLNPALILTLVAVAVVGSLAFYMASKGKKKVIIQRVY